MAATMDNNELIDLVIITIREDEHAAVLRQIPGHKPLHRTNRTYSIATVHNRHNTEYRVAAVRTPGKGPGPAQDTTRDAIEDLDPAWIMLVGIAGGVPDSEFTLGDVVIATRVHDFTTGAAYEERRPEYANQGGPMSKQVENFIAYLPALRVDLAGWNAQSQIACARPSVDLSEKNIYGDEEWRKKVRKSVSFHFGADAKREPTFVTREVASSGLLVKNSKVVKQWKETARDLVAVEMELGGVYVGARRRHKEYPILAIRGISDIVGFERGPEWTPYACETAASLCFALLKNIPPDFIPQRSGIGHASREKWPLRIDNGSASTFVQYEERDELDGKEIVRETLDKVEVLAGKDLFAARQLLLQSGPAAHRRVLSKLESIRRRLRVAKPYRLPTGERAETIIQVADAILQTPEIGSFVAEDPLFPEWLSEIVERPDLASIVRAPTNSRWETIVHTIESDSQLPQRIRDGLIKLRKQESADVREGSRESLLRALSRDPDQVEIRLRLAGTVQLPTGEECTVSMQCQEHEGLRYVKVPAGRSKIGAGLGTARPSRWVEFKDGFWMSQSPVTVGAFAMWKHSSPRSEGQHHWPVVDAYWETCRDYCKTVGGRLPTEDEWEYAAQGGVEGFLYPWGNEISPAHALYNLGDVNLPWRTLMMKFPTNRFGLFDIVGGLWEWCADGELGRKVVKGGSWRSKGEQLQISYREMRSSELKGALRDETGFRCVLA